MTPANRLRREEEPPGRRHDRQHARRVPRSTAAATDRGDTWTRSTGHRWRSGPRRLDRRPARGARRARVARADRDVGVGRSRRRRAPGAHRRAKTAVPRDHGEVGGPPPAQGAGLIRRRGQLVVELVERRRRRVRRDDSPQSRHGLEARRTARSIGHALVTHEPVRAVVRRGEMSRYPLRRRVIPLSSPRLTTAHHVRIHTGSVGVRGSSPLSSTSLKLTDIVDSPGLHD
jgi:hypothetical protein